MKVCDICCRPEVYGSFTFERTENFDLCKKCYWKVIKVVKRFVKSKKCEI